SHIGLANAAWWFPGDNAVSQAATRLMAFSMVENKFLTYDKPDPQFSDAQTRRNVVINTASALHTPYWMNNDIHVRSYDDIEKMSIRRRGKK
ncbi:hypothetical protein, partial [Staphylococcus aureus]|uniref:hypothetical protein n=1 Tax=Staphylococcus aureus TaxID=1280 RepID=UPI00166806F3